MDDNPPYVAILASGTREADVVEEFQTRMNKAMAAGYVLHSTAYFVSSSQMTIGPIHNILAHLTRYTFYQAEARKEEA